jgi:purine-binding chemotaxis protein CheW
MEAFSQLVNLTLDDQCYALPLVQVERVIHAIEVTPLPDAPDVILGVINLRGKVIAVINLRQRFGLPERKISPQDNFIIATTTHRRIALVADSVNGVIEIPQSRILGAADILPHMEYVEGVVRLEDGLVLIHDLERFLSLEEGQGLDQALGEAAG